MRRKAEHKQDKRTPQRHAPRTPSLTPEEQALVHALRTPGMGEALRQLRAKLESET